MKKKIINYDNLNLEVKKDSLKRLEENYFEIERIFSTFMRKLNIENFMKVGSSLNECLRKYRSEIDILAIYDGGDGSINPKKNKEILEKIKDSFLESTISLDIEEKYSLIISESRGSPFLSITITEDFREYDGFSMFKIIPCNKYSPKLQMILKFNSEMMRSLKGQSLSDLQTKELKTLSRFLKYLKDNKWPDLKGEIVDLLIYNITRKFSEIDIIRNIKRFFEFIALGGLSCNKDNKWFWEEFPESFNDYIQKELEKLEKNQIEKMERDSKQLINSGFESIVNFQ